MKFATKKLNSQINLLFNFLIQKYFFHDNPTWNVNYSVIGVGKNGIRIDKFDLELKLVKWNGSVARSGQTFTGGG